MFKALIEDIFNEPECSEDAALPATDNELLILTEKLSRQYVPTKVFFQAVAIAAYDRASAFRYADNYLTTHKNKNKRKNILLLSKSVPDFENN